MKAGIIPREGREAFEKRALEERDRRTSVKKVDEAMKSVGADAVARDQYWNDTAQNHLRSLRSDAERRKVLDLVKQFAIAQRNFYEAYEHFLEKENELHEQQQSLQAFQRIAQIAGIVSSAIQLGTMVSSGNAPVSTSSEDPGAVDTMIRVYERQIDSSTGDVKTWDLKTTIREKELLELNSDLIKSFEKNGVNIPEADRKLVLPQRP